MSLLLWNHPVTAERYRLFTERHDRYRVVAAALAEAAAVAPGHKVLDIAAGVGCTALACLQRLGENDTVAAAEAADAMRQEGERRTRGRTVNWYAAPPQGQTYDRVICGAALWALGPAGEVIGQMSHHVAPKGALAVSLPAAYLGEADAPGGGPDPHLTSLPEALKALNLGKPPGTAQPLLSETGLRQAFADHGFVMSRSSIRLRLTQDAYCHWLALPPVNDTLLGQVPPEDRPELVYRCAEDLDMSSWRWESWALCVGTRLRVRSHK
ncbi:methyltransferase domain-containing protein [Roseibium sp. MMSF_3412]|uniref:methyltransferase domain-containing protein n=1 Tax=Roseibium sp. MMSF_3412 TaxID=3046712 RepID=UPI00273EF46D|nr:methyltransferase domain-containing protein [Roseibium sp. MMSF_3412]